MKVTSEPTDDCQVVLTIEVDPERVERSLEHAYRRLAGRVNIPGFRKGKAPRPIVERYLGGRAALLEDALERLVPEVFQEAIKEQEIQPVADPRFEVTQLEPVTVRATVPLPPRVELGDYQAIRQPAPQVEVTDPDVDQVLKNLRERQVIWEPIERPVELGDRVVIDLEATRDGESLFSRQGFEYDVDAENRAPAPGFAEQLVGLAKDETKAFDLSFAADYELEQFAGKRYHYTVTVHDIKVKRLPELDDDFAKAAAEDVETLDQLKVRVRENLRQRKEAEARDQLEDEVIDAAVAASTIVVPPALIEREIDLMLQQQEQALAEQRISLSQYLQWLGKEPAAYREELSEQARRRLNRKLILERVAEAEGITVPEAEIERDLGQLAEHQGNKEQPFSPEVRAAVERILARRHALDRLVEIATEGVVQPRREADQAESAIAAEVEVAAEPAEPVVQSAVASTTEE